MKVDFKGAVIIILTAAVLIASTMVLDMYRRLESSAVCSCACECKWDVSAREVELKEVTYEYYDLKVHDKDK